MSETSTHLALPYLMAAQAQKHVTMNEALRLLDGIVQLSVLDRDLTSPPGNPTEGGRYIVAASATDVWTGWEGSVAYWVDGAWHRLMPQTGWLAWIEDEGILVAWDGSGWVIAGGDNGDAEFDTVGIGGASGDSTNRLAINSPATLLNNAGAGHQVKINKNAAGDTASLLYQTGWSGRAEMGLAGNDEFSIKVSSDGSSWVDALKFSSAGIATGAAVQSTPIDTTAGRLMLVGAFGLGLTGAAEQLDDLNSLLSASGFYRIGGQTTGTTPTGGGSTGAACLIADSGQHRHQIFFPRRRAEMFVRAYNNAVPEWTTWLAVLSTGNTVVDANGFIKSASPIVRLFADQITEPVATTGAQFMRVSPGVYRLSGTLGLAQQGWQIEVPQDHNGNRLCHVLTEWDGDAMVLTVRVATPVWSDGRWVAGEPIDVPEGRWIDIRLHEELPADQVDPDEGETI